MTEGRDWSPESHLGALDGETVHSGEPVAAHPLKWDPTKRIELDNGCYLTFKPFAGHDDGA